MFRPRSRLTPTGHVKFVKLMFTPLEHRSSPLLSVISLLWMRTLSRQHRQTPLTLYNRRQAKCT
jgi:hypothetical protein